jgi:hypothetical protein
MKALQAEQNRVAEWALTTRRDYADPSELELTAVVTDPEGAEHRVPAFWTGGGTWRVRYSSPLVGPHPFRMACSDEDNRDLHGREGEIVVSAYSGANPLFGHGPIQVSEDNRHFEHADGTPFFWLGDTWWMGLCGRLRWPEEFERLTADRLGKGFTVVQLAAGLYPDMPPFDQRGANEAGFPWDEEYRTVNPSYFEMADRRIQYLVEKSLVPCILGCWGQYLHHAGVEGVKRHWRYLVARYGAYPVVWCIGGEVMDAAKARMRALRQQASVEAASAPEGGLDKEYRRWAKNGWSEVTRYVRSIDPFGRAMTIHPTTMRCSQAMLNDPCALDFSMILGGHSGWHSLRQMAEVFRKVMREEARMPLLIGEACYEGIAGDCGPDVQRFAFWSSMLSGAAGHTYGANGIWQVNRRQEPFGASPSGLNWGTTPWEAGALWRFAQRAELGHYPVGRGHGLPGKPSHAAGQGTARTLRVVAIRAPFGLDRAARRPGEPGVGLRGRYPPPGEGLLPSARLHLYPSPGRLAPAVDEPGAGRNLRRLRLHTVHRR